MSIEKIHELAKAIADTNMLPCNTMLFENDRIFLLLKKNCIDSRLRQLCQ